MKAAAERIAEGGKSITQIATELGYDNFHYFSIHLIHILVLEYK